MVFGVNRYKSAAALWMDKTGQLPYQEAGKAAYWGTQLEPFVRTEFTRRTGIEVRQVKQHLPSEGHPFMLANLGEVCEVADFGICTFEAKTAPAYTAGEWEDSKQQMQFQHYMVAPRYAGTYIAVLIGGNSFRWTFVKRDKKLIAMLVELEADFWDYVRLKTPPPLDSSSAATKSLAERFPYSQPISRFRFPFCDLFHS